jgi:Glycosyl transferase 4-like domain/Glycosyl transferases group 1
VSDLPRVLFCIFGVVPSPNAASRRLRAYARALMGRAELTILSVKSHDLPHIVTLDGARLLRIPVGAADLRQQVETFGRAVLRQLDSEEYALVHLFDPLAGFEVARQRSRLPAKIIFEAASFPSIEWSAEPEPDFRNINWAKRLELLCLMNADAVLVPNEMLHQTVNALGVEASRIAAVPPAALSFDHQHVDTRNESLQLLHLGSPTPLNDLATVIEGLSLLDAKHRVSLTLRGEEKRPKHWEVIRAKVAALGVASKVHFEPALAEEQLRPAIAAADVGLLSLSRAERNVLTGAPLARAVDFLAAGKPLLYADVAAVSNLMPAQVGVAYQPEDPASFARAVEHLLDAQARQRMATAARAAAEAFSETRVGQSLTSVYFRLGGHQVFDAKPFAYATPAITDPHVPVVSAPPASTVRFDAPAPAVVEPEVDEIAEDEVFPLSDGTLSDEPTRPPRLKAHPPPSLEGKWKAQFLFGYCPPKLG